LYFRLAAARATLNNYLYFRLAAARSTLNNYLYFRLAAARATLQKELEYVQTAQNSHYAVEEVNVLVLSLFIPIFIQYWVFQKKLSTTCMLLPKYVAYIINYWTGSSYLI
jgi:hypothetical protein